MATPAVSSAADQLAASTAAALNAGAKSVPLLCRGHSRPVVDLAFSPITPDGFFVISACLDGKPMLRAGATGDWIGTFEGHKGAVWSARLNSTAHQAATGSADYTAKLWNALTGDEIASFAHKRIVKTVAFSPDDSKILTGGQEKLLRLFDLAKPEADPLILEGHTETVKIAQWNAPAGENILISGGSDSTLRIWDLREAKEVRSIPMQEPITSMELTANHLTVTHGRVVTFFDPTNFNVIKSFTLPIPPLNSASLHPDTTKFVVGCADLWVRVYDYASGQELELHKGHHGPVHCIRFSPDGELYASGSEDGTIRLWQTVPKTYGLWQLTPPS